MADVAARVGASTITVSRALRQPGMVSEPLRRRIDEAVRELGYVPNPAARALASRRSNVIGVIVPSLTNNVFTDVLAGIYDLIEAMPFDVQLGNTRYVAEKEEDLVRVFLSQQPVGLIVTGTDQSPATRSLLERAGCPVVQIMEIGPDPIDMMIGFSHFEAARTATEHLLAQGYRRPAFLGARMDPRSHRRLAGFRAAASAAGRFAAERVVTTPEPSSVGTGRRLLAHLLEQEPAADAVFCNNDDLAIGAQFEALERGIAAPANLGICGFNDFETMAAAHPPLTSVRTFRYEMGRLSVDMLAKRLSDPSVAPASIDLGYRLEVRQSTLGP